MCLITQGIKIKKGGAEMHYKKSFRSFLPLLNLPTLFFSTFILTPLLIFFLITTASAEQNDRVDIHDNLVLYYAPKGNTHNEEVNDEIVFISILQEERFGNADGSYVENCHVNERWHYSGGNIVDIRMRNGKLWWSFLPARNTPIR